VMADPVGSDARFPTVEVIDMSSPEPVYNVTVFAPCEKSHPDAVRMLFISLPADEDTFWMRPLETKTVPA
jgi:hypothetical protein